MMTRMGFAGNDCALAATQKKIRAAKAASRFIAQVYLN
jgi:hypothetical protein